MGERLLESFCLELGEEIESRKEMLLLAVAGGVFMHMALLMATLLVAVVFWDTHRVAAVAAMTALYLAGGAAAFVFLRRKASSRPAPFPVTRAELDKDLVQLRLEARKLRESLVMASRIAIIGKLAWSLVALVRRK